jgi:hypothetical protein
MPLCFSIPYYLLPVDNNNPEYVIQELKKYYDPFYMKEDKIPGG